VTSCVLAIDIGGTTVKAALVDETGQSHHLISRPSTGGDNTVDVVRAVLTQLAEAATADGLEAVAAGVVTPGIVDDAAGRVGYASNLGWRNLDLRTPLETDLGLPVSIGHDVRAAGRAEALLGSARGASDFVLVQLGTGISAALMTADQIVTGVGNAAGEVGHMPVYPRGERCSCGQRGCLEVYASGAGIARRYRSAGGHSTLTAEQIVTVLGADPAADRVWSAAVEALALATSTLTMTLDPALIVIGGGLVRAGEVLLKPVRASLAELLTWREAPPIVPSTLGPVAGRIGAALEAYARTPLAAVTHAWTPDVLLAPVL